jgi:hypothetical protein
MTLRNKDGTVYKLPGPNPVMRDQKLWADFQTHNLKWSPEKSEDTTVVTPVQSDFQTPRDSFLDALDRATEEVKHEIKVVENLPEIKKQDVPEIKVVENPVQTPLVERKPIVVPDKEQLAATSEDTIPKTFIHCLPAFVRERRDALYGETYKTIKYGQPFSFEGVILDQGDLTIDVWTDIDKILVGSVLFPKIPYSRRWWRVQKREAKAGGWLLSAVPSDYQPSFDASS